MNTVIYITLISRKQILTIIFKNILMTFEAEILKIFKNIQPQSKNKALLYERV